MLDKENMYRNTSSSSRQPKSLIIKKRPLSRKRSSSTTKNTNFREINDNNDSSMSFESSLSSDDENYEDIQECREIDESELVHISSHTNQKTLSSHKKSCNSKVCIKRNVVIPPPIPLIKRRPIEAELTYCIFNHKMHNEQLHLEYDKIQMCNDDIGTNDAILDENNSKIAAGDKSCSNQNLSGYESDLDNSIRHLFYLEYRCKIDINPVVYSRFGKKKYLSDEKFDPK